MVVFYALVQLLNFQLVFLFEFLERQVRSGLVVGHVVVPGVRKFEELVSLCRLNSHKFLFLRLPHILQLAEHFLVL